METTTITEEVLFFLYRNHYFNKRHTSVVNVCNKLSQFPCKLVKKELNKLYKVEIIRYKKTAHGMDVFLNVKMKRDIEKIISDRMDSLYSL